MRIDESLMRLPLAVVATVVINALIFAGLPLLTRVSGRERQKAFEMPIMIAHIKPPKPPEEQKPRELKERELKKMTRRKTSKASARPKIDASQFDFATGLGGGDGIGIRIGGMDKMREFKSEMQNIEFELTEVDTPPRATRKAPPVYPFSAKRSGIRGIVVIRCLVGIDGRGKKFTIIKSEPKGIFDEAGLAAVKKWRFKPGILGGEPVPTWVRIPFKFELN